MKTSVILTILKYVNTRHVKFTWTRDGIDGMVISYTM